MIYAASRHHAPKFPESTIHLSRLMVKLHKQAANSASENTHDAVALRRELAHLRQRVQELEDTQQAAESANQAKSQFVASLSHEFRTALNSVVGMATLLGDTELDATQHEFVRAIQQSSNAMLALIADVLDLARVDSGNLELEYVPFLVATLLETTCTVFRHQAGQKSLELTCELDPGVPTTLVGDETRLRQVLFNLVSNAIKFTERGEVAVRLSASERDAPLLIAESHDYLPAYELEIIVSDTGLGISASDLMRIFDPFTRMHPRSTEGAGLGLSITRRLVEAMDGRISVESDPGVGSIFRVTLPVYGCVVALTSPEPEPPPVPTVPLRGLRVLIVEDNELNAQVLLHTVQRMVQHTDLVRSGHEALERLTAASYDLILLDIQMPDLDGVAVMRHVRRRTPPATCPEIIAVTAYAVAGARQWLTEAGFDDYIEKPIRLSRLEQSLHAAAERLAARPAMATGLLASAPAVPPPRMAVPVYDPTALAELVEVLGGDATTAEEIVSMYLHDLDQRLEELLHYARAHDPVACAKVAHSMVSLAAQIGALQLAEVIAQIETAPPVHAIELDAVVVQIQEAYSQFYRVLRQNGVQV